jgi:hypothetical protein
VTHEPEQLHRHGRRRVIGLVLAGCVLVGGLGAAAGEVFDPAVAQPKEAAEPTLGVVVSPGDAASRAGPASVVRMDGATEDPNLTGVEYDLGYGARIFVPAPDWQVYERADTRLWAMNGKGSFAFAAAGKYADASVRAGDVLAQNLQGLLPPDTYTQLQTNGPRDFGAVPYGDIVSWSILDYKALWTDPQGAVSIYGQLYAGVRKDGAVLVVLIEHVPPDDWNDTLYPRASIVEQSFLRFSGQF